MLNSYLRDGIFNQHLTTIKDSYVRQCDTYPLSHRAEPSPVAWVDARPTGSPVVAGSIPGWWHFVLAIWS